MGQYPVLNLIKVTQDASLTAFWVTFLEQKDGILTVPSFSFVLLDPFSTSQTKRSRKGFFMVAEYDSEWQIEAHLEFVQTAKTMRCPRNAPFICYKNSVGAWYLVQANCNSWLCPRCGILRAGEEYGRMVEGSKALWEQGHKLYFHTYTCRGKEVSIQEADKNYMLWTNRLLTTLRKDSTKRKHYWSYVQVTERQKRGHAHSHCISTYCPSDVVPYVKGEKLPNDRKAKHDCLWSEYLRARCVDAGLGVECDLSEIRNPVAVAVYTAKYLFKDAQVTEFAKGWRRIRYSQSFPKLPTIQGKEAFAVVKHKDWQKIENLGVSVRCKVQWIEDLAYAHLVTNVAWTGEE